jgi:hypothetical protein
MLIFIENNARGIQSDVLTDYDSLENEWTIDGLRMSHD